MIRRLCLAYPGTTPADYERLTRDQIYIMMLPEDMLKSLSRVQTMSVHAAQQRGLIPDDREELGGYRSLAEKLTAEAEGKKVKSKKELRRERRELQLQAKQRRGQN